MLGSGNAGLTPGISLTAILSSWKMLALNWCKWGSAHTVTPGLAAMQTDICSSCNLDRSFWKGWIMREVHSHLFKAALHGNSPKSLETKAILWSFPHSSGRREVKRGHREKCFSMPKWCETQEHFRKSKGCCCCQDLGLSQATPCSLSNHIPSCLSNWVIKRKMETQQRWKRQFGSKAFGVPTDMIP